MAKVSTVRFEEYKSFPKGVPEELSMKPYVSVFIGKNNAGKSSCLDAIECVFNPEYFLSINKSFAHVSVAFELDAEKIECGFRRNLCGGDVPGNHHAYGSKFVGKNFYVDVKKSTNINDNNLVLGFSQYQPDLDLPNGAREWETIVRSFGNFQNGFAFHRINADRDILPETESSNENVYYNGDGATNLVRKFINHSAYDEKVIENLLLDNLNKIMDPDAHFKSIRVQEIEIANTIKWEIFLEEDDRRRFALSKSGSGLKTIILMLINLYAIPATKNYKDKHIVYAFEELENNLHPALQRKVFEFLYEYAVQNDRHIFITTHSPIAINTFIEKDSTEIYHVQKKDGKSSISAVKDRTSRLDVFSDLDVRASDLFQSNGIIWVEGPSDRIYIKRWLDIFCDSKYLEGSHYQFLYYGGKNLAHFTAEDNLDGFINILTTNQNAAIVIDSDKRSRNDRINQTKSRIKREFENINCFCWITKGKEVENYLSTECLRECFGSTVPVLGQHQHFPDYIKPYYKWFSNKKVPFSQMIAEHITKNNSEAVLDLKRQVERLYECIQEWNR